MLGNGVASPLMRNQSFRSVPSAPRVLGSTAAGAEVAAVDRASVHNSSAFGVSSVRSRAASSPPPQQPPATSVVQSAAVGAKASSTAQSNYRVFIRVRPFLPADRDPLDPSAFPLPPFEIRGGTECVFIDQATGMPREAFLFDGAFCSITPEQWARVPELAGLPPDSPFFPRPITQRGMYEACAQPMVGYVLDGYNASILAYGQTSSGKTHTMTGYAGPDGGDEEGIIPRLCRDLLKGAAEVLENAKAGGVRQLSSDGGAGFSSPNSPLPAGAAVVSPTAAASAAQLGRLQCVDFTMDIAFFEIYNENVLDLLDSATVGSGGAGAGSGGHRKRKVRSHPVLGVYIDGLTFESVTSWEQCARLIAKGVARRHVASTRMNDQSSRSHAVMQLRMTQTELSELGPLQRRSNVHLADLAGSERIKASQVEGDRLKEAAQINLSLTTLRRVIDALISGAGKGGGGGGGARGGGGGGGGGSDPIIPYRDSLLTWVLSDSLGGNAKSCMIATLCPHPSYSEESFHTLQYASRAKSIVSTVVRNEDQMAQMIRGLQETIAKEAAAAAAAAGLAGGGNGFGGPSQEQVAELEAAAARAASAVRDAADANARADAATDAATAASERAAAAEDSLEQLSRDNALLLHEIQSVRDALWASEAQLSGAHAAAEGEANGRRAADERAAELADDAASLRAEVASLRAQLAASEAAAREIFGERTALSADVAALEEELQLLAADRRAAEGRAWAEAHAAYGPMLRWHSASLAAAEEAFFKSQRATLTAAVVNTAVHQVKALAQQLAQQRAAVATVVAAAAGAERVNREHQGVASRVAALYVRVRDFLTLYGGGGGGGGDEGRSFSAVPRAEASADVLGLGLGARNSAGGARRPTLQQQTPQKQFQASTRRGSPAPRGGVWPDPLALQGERSDPNDLFTRFAAAHTTTRQPSATAVGAMAGVGMGGMGPGLGGMIPQAATVREVLAAFHAFVGAAEAEEGIVATAIALKMRGDLMRFGPPNPPNAPPHPTASMYLDLRMHDAEDRSRNASFLVGEPSGRRSASAPRLGFGGGVASPLPIRPSGSFNDASFLSAAPFSFANDEGAGGQGYLGRHSAAAAEATRRAREREAALEEVNTLRAEQQRAAVTVAGLEEDKAALRAALAAAEDALDRERAERRLSEQQQQHKQRQRSPPQPQPHQGPHYSYPQPVQNDSFYYDASAAAGGRPVSATAASEAAAVAAAGGSQALVAAARRRAASIAQRPIAAEEAPKEVPWYERPDPSLKAAPAAHGGGSSQPQAIYSAAAVVPHSDNRSKAREGGNWYDAPQPLKPMAASAAPLDVADGPSASNEVDSTDGGAVNRVRSATVAAPTASPLSPFSRGAGDERSPAAADGYSQMGTDASRFPMASPSDVASMPSVSQPIPPPRRRDRSVTLPEEPPTEGGSGEKDASPGDAEVGRAETREERAQRKQEKTDRKAAEKAQKEAEKEERRRLRAEGREERQRERGSAMAGSVRSLRSAEPSHSANGTDAEEAARRSADAHASLGNATVRHPSVAHFLDSADVGSDIVHSSAAHAAAPFASIAIGDPRFASFESEATVGGGVPSTSGNGARPTLALLRPHRDARSEVSSDAAGGHAALTSLGTVAHFR